MSVFAAGSVPWLIGHELRITFRNSSRGSRIGAGIAAGIIATLTVVAGVPVALMVRRYTLPLTPIIVFSTDLGLTLLFSLLLSQTLASATQAFYERGDLDLLLSSPLPPRRVLTVRALTIAVAPFVLFASLLSPFLVPLAFFGHAAWLSVYGVLASLALSASAFGLVIAMALFRVIGPRRTRTIGQVLSAFIGAGFFLLTQSRNLFPHNGSLVLAGLKTLTRMTAISSTSVLAWPVRALVGEPVPLVAVMGVSALLFVGSASVLGARFARNASAAVGVDAPRSTRTSARQRPFRQGVARVLVSKDLTLLARDPALLSQVLLRVLYLIPLLYVLLRNAASNFDSAVATGSATLTFMASQVAASLTWITISAEDAPDLLASAPIEPSTVMRVKLVAVMLPIVALLALPMLGLAWFSPRAAIGAVLGVTGASISSALINIWYEKPGQRKNFRRRGSGSFAATIAEMIVGMGWAATAFLGVAGSPWVLLLLVLTLLVLGAFRIGRNKPE